MSEALLPLLGVLIGGLLAPFAQGIGYIVERHLKERDESREDRRKALIALQDTSLDLVAAEEESMRTDYVRQAEANQRRAIAKRKIRLQAARIGDERLWNLVHTPNPDRMREVHASDSPGEPGDMYDDWNKRIRELFSAN